MNCDRCGTKMNIYTMSMFNTQEICMECENKEREHPDYPHAVAMEHQACLAGNFNFEGVGLPEDL